MSSLGLSLPPYVFSYSVAYAVFNAFAYVVAKKGTHMVAYGATYAVAYVVAYKVAYAVSYVTNQGLVGRRTSRPSLKIFCPLSTLMG